MILFFILFYIFVKRYYFTDIVIVCYNNTNIYFIIVSMKIPTILTKSAFSIIEVMVGIFIFTLWISAVYMVISSTSNINIYNKSFLIASNLSREQIELVRNIRDTNYQKFQKWNMLHPNGTQYDVVFTGSTTWWLYTLENSYDFTIIAGTGAYISESDFKKWVLKQWATVEEYRLCLENWYYKYCKGLPGTPVKTFFYRYIEIQALTDKSVWWAIIKNAFKIRSNVFWSQKWAHSTHIDTILTDWKRL